MTPSDSSERNHGRTLRSALIALERMQERVSALERMAREPIAIIGMGCRLPGEIEDPEQYWDLLRQARDAISEVPPERWDGEAFFDPHPNARGKSYSRWGGFLSQLDGFDPRFFGVSPRESHAMDPQQRLMLEVAWETLEHAGMPRSQLAGSSTGVFAGSCNSDYARLQASAEQMDAYAATGEAGYLLAGRISHIFDLRGPSMTVDTACSSSAVAVHLACQSLRLQECDLAIAGGVNLMLSPVGMVAMARMKALSADGHCKPFDARADGIARSEGCGLVALKRLSDAIASGDRIEAVIRGTAMNQDGRTNGLTAPNGESQERVVEAALRNAEIEPSRVGYVETHGTGTVLGDPIEVEALQNALASEEGSRRSCVLGSVKANLGHLEAAAGIVGLIKAVLVVQRGIVPAQIHFENPNPHLALAESPFVVPREEMPWACDEAPRCAGVSSFGFAGTNVHLIVEQGPVPSSQSSARGAAEEGAGEGVRELLLPISARSTGALESLVAAYRDRLEGAGQRAPAERPEVRLDVEDLAYTASLRRTHFDQRVAVVGKDPRELRDALAHVLADGALRTRPKARARELALVFPELVDARPECFRGLLHRCATFAETVDGCDRMFEPLMGVSLSSELCKWEASVRNADSTLRRALGFAIQLGLARQWREWGIRPQLLLAQGEGEIAAACSAGAISMERAARWIANQSEPGEEIAATHSAGTTSCPVYRIEGGAEGSAPEADEKASEGSRILLVLGSSTEGEKAFDHGADPSWLSMNARPVHEQYQELLRSLARLYEAGQEVNWSSFFPNGGRCVVLPSYRWQRSPHPLLPKGSGDNGGDPKREDAGRRLRRP